MQIGKEKVVTIEYTLKNDSGAVLESTEGHEPMKYIHGVNPLIPKLEQALEGKSSGESFEVQIGHADAFGVRDEQNVATIPRDRLPEDAPVEVGNQFQTQDAQGNPMMLIVTKVTESEVTLDGNHPYAGVDLHFSVSVKEVREATPEEIDHGHVHGPGGHQH